MSKYMIACGKLKGTGKSQIKEEAVVIEVVGQVVGQTDIFVHDTISILKKARIKKAALDRLTRLELLLERERSNR